MLSEEKQKMAILRVVYLSTYLKHLIQLVTEVYSVNFRFMEFLEQNWHGSLIISFIDHKLFNSNVCCQSLNPSLQVYLKEVS